MFRRLWRIAAPVVAIALLGVPLSVHANTTYVENISSGGSVSLYDLLHADTDGLGGTDIIAVQVGDKLFENFSNYSSSADGTASIVDPHNIFVSAVTNGTEEGIRLSSSSWKVNTNSDQDTGFEYDVTSVIGNLIHDITLKTTGGAFANSEWDVAETVLPSSSALNTELADSSGTSTTILDHVAFTPVTVAHVSKDISLSGYIGGTGSTPNHAFISHVDQTFSQVAVPLPATANMGLALLGCLGGLGAIRRMKLKKECELA